MQKRSTNGDFKHGTKKAADRRQAESAALQNKHMVIIPEKGHGQNGKK